MNDMLDLAVIVPDLDIENTMQTLLDERPESLDIASVNFKIYRHPQRDAGIRLRGAEFARGLIEQYRYCLLIFDHHGSGAENMCSVELEAEIRRQLESTGWAARAEVIVISPELEVWLWGRETHLSAAIGWSGEPLHRWLEQQFCPVGRLGKPEHPKEALEMVLRRLGRPRSASIYGRVAKACSLRDCRDPAFNRLRDILRTWFPSSSLGSARR